jgi:hypothetical protein
MGIKLTPVAPNNPQCNGFAENFVKTLCKLIHSCSTEDKDPRRELNKFLLQYRATPHLSTGRPPAEMLFNRRIRTKIPQNPTVDQTDEKRRIRTQHDSKKREQKRQFDKRHRATPKSIKVGDQVLIKQQKSTTRPPYNPEPLTVTLVNGNTITATNGRISRTRGKNCLKVLKHRPEHLKPSWEKPRTQRTTTPEPYFATTSEVPVSAPAAVHTDEPESSVGCRNGRADGSIVC